MQERKMAKKWKVQRTYEEERRKIVQEQKTTSYGESLPASIPFSFQMIPENTELQDVEKVTGERLVVVRGMCPVWCDTRHRRKITSQR